jgi:hypothetical protein
MMEMKTKTKHKRLRRKETKAAKLTQQQEPN